MLFNGNQVHCFKFINKVVCIWLCAVPPSIRTSPASGQLTARKGGTITLECKASGNPVPSILWSRKVSVFVFQFSPCLSSKLTDFRLKKRDRSREREICGSWNRLDHFYEVALCVALGNFLQVLCVLALKRVQKDFIFRLGPPRDRTPTYLTLQSNVQFQTLHNVNSMHWIF